MYYTYPYYYENHILDLKKVNSLYYFRSMVYSANILGINLLIEDFILL